MRTGCCTQKQKKEEPRNCDTGVGGRRPSARLRRSRNAITANRGTFSHPDIQRFAHLANDNIRLHPMKKRSRGRPKKGARFQSALEKAQKNKEKRVVTCQYCFKKGHTSRSCKHAKEAKAAAAEAAAPAADDEN